MDKRTGRARWVTRMSSVMVLSGSLAGCFGPDDPLEGMWEGTNYQCPTGIAFREKVKITSEDGILKAVKITGDACVPAGEVAFIGTRDEVICSTGDPADPMNGEFPSRIDVVDDDTFTACTVRFIRLPDEE